MKYLIILLAIALTSPLSAQTGYENAMSRGLQMIEKADNPSKLNAASSFFETIANSEKNQWLPYYYAAYARLMSAFQDETTDKDKAASQANAFIMKADSLNPNNSEIFCLKYLSATLALIVDPMTRYQTYGMEAKTALDKAKSLDSSNPRVLYLEASGTLNTPEQYGGGKAKAKPLFVKALKLFKTFQPASPLHPNWGKEKAQDGLQQCND